MKVHVHSCGIRARSWLSHPFSCDAPWCSSGSTAATRQGRSRPTAARLPGERQRGREDEVVDAVVLAHALLNTRGGNGLKGHPFPPPCSVPVLPAQNAGPLFRRFFGKVLKPKNCPLDSFCLVICFPKGWGNAVRLRGTAGDPMAPTTARAIDRAHDGGNNESLQDLRHSTTIGGYFVPTTLQAA